MYVRIVGGSWGTWRDFKQAQGEHGNTIQSFQCLKSSKNQCIMIKVFNKTLKNAVIQY